jgi:hypothetical protein
MSTAAETETVNMPPMLTIWSTWPSPHRAYAMVIAAVSLNEYTVRLA